MHHSTASRPSDLAGRAQSAGWRATAGAYVSLTKPRIIELLLVTTVPTMFLAQGGLPPLMLIVHTLCGGALAAASANVFNCYIDRDIDELMVRTRKRPMVTGAVSGPAALVFGSALGVAALLWLGLGANWLSSLLAGAAILLYVVFYTLILKRRTSQNIVWGGVAGCMPVLIGWSAVAGRLDWAPLALFGVVFFWTPPHYWPLSMKYKGDYAEADVPMLGATRDGIQVGLQVILYAWATVACSLLLIPVAGMGLVYTVSALVFGGWFVYESHVLYNRAVRGEQIKPMRVFHASITYLTLLFLAIAVDPLLPF